MIIAWSFCVLYVAFFHKVTAQQSGSSDDNFTCNKGTVLNGDYCFLLIDEPMIWSDANRTCIRLGYDLLWVNGDEEYNGINDVVPTSWSHYWTGLYKPSGTNDINDARWTYDDHQLFKLNKVTWETGQPDPSAGYCVLIKKDGYFSFGNCLEKLAFVCKSHAVRKGDFICSNGKGVQNEDVCNGHNDCGDYSDELDCGLDSDQCSKVIDAQPVQSGTLSSSGVYSNGNTCYWTIVAGIGQTIKIAVRSFRTEKNTDVLQFRTGGMSGEIYLGELTGTIDGQRTTYYSSDNVFLLRFITDNSVTASGFTIDWTTNVPEVFNDVKMLTATSSVQKLKSPFYDTGYLPHEKVLEWIITANTENVVTLEFVIIKIGSSGQLYLWEGVEKTLNLTLNGVCEFKSKIYISRSKSVRLMLRTEGGGIAAFNEGLYVKYWEGCTVNLQSNYGIIQSPGYLSGSYPENTICQWTVRRPQAETRSISLRFNGFDVQGLDYLRVHNDSQSVSVPSSPLHTGAGFTGSDRITSMIFRSYKGVITLEFESNNFLTDKGFEAEFSVDCSSITVSSNTIIITNQMYETSFRSEVTLTCAPGYSFKQEEFNAMSSVPIRCERGGEWNVTRIPDCIIIYCPIPPNIDYGYISSSSGIVYGANVIYECDDGFGRIGHNVIECSEAGKWSTPPSCIAIGCPAIPPPRNGALDILEGGGTDYASVIRFICDEGYDLVGNLTIHCITGGVWSHDVPVCEEIWCPLPSIPDGSLDTSNDLRFGMTATLYCDQGYGINGTETTFRTVTCGADGMLDIIPCLDINECARSLPVCPYREVCTNIPGDFTCTCKDGYERLPGNSHCTDIDECSREPTLCDQGCINTVPGYYCSCSPGFLLYTGEGFNNISLADGETGMRHGDVYRINHTCVRRQCPLPQGIPNGKVLTTKKLIYYEDDVNFVCNHGFVTSDLTKLKCEMFGQYSGYFPTCSVATCIKPKRNEIARAVGVYPVTVPKVDYGAKVTIECQYGSVRINRTLFCSYDVMTGQYQMMGDAQECPEINCGQPDNVLGSVYYGKSTTTLGSTFTFGCIDGFTIAGVSQDGSTTVTCLENGRWNLRNLTCIGEKRCSDPGTPAAAVQIVESYELGQKLFFRCYNQGYYPMPPEPFECVRDSTGNVTWNSSLLPECTDLTSPVFTNCPKDPIYIDKSEIYSYTVPTATDNSGGVKSVTNLTPAKGPGKNTNTDISIVYQAEDYSGNTANCTIQIKIKDYADHLLTCPIYPTNRRSVDTAEGVMYNVSDYVSVTNYREDIVLQFSPTKFISLDHTFIENHQVVEVTATDKWGRQDKCRIHLKSFAAGCFKESFPDVQNGVESCTSGDVSCTLTCNTGYIMFDGNSSRTYSCTKGNAWTPALPPQYACIEHDEPEHLIEFMVVYTTVQTDSSRQFASDCVDGLRQLLLNYLMPTFTSEIHSVCNNAFVQAGNIKITDMHLTSSSFDFRTTYTIRLLDATTTKEATLACYSILALQVSKTSFLDFTNTVSCRSGSSSVNRKTDYNNKMISQGTSCSAGIKTVTDIGERCIKCPPGTYLSSRGVFTACPDGQFQDLYGQSSCKSCSDSTLVPSTDKTTCLSECPPGFISDNGLPSCSPCPEDTYWINSTHCEQCPDGGQTLGFNGVPNLSDCALPCSTGQFSVTGYAPCKPCPENFYQDQIGQEQCIECASNQITKGPGANSANECIYLETVCQMKREINLAGNDADWDRDETKPQPSLEACEQYCLDSSDCLSVSYIHGYCFVFHQPTTTQTKLGSTSSLKECIDSQFDIDCGFNNLSSLCNGNGYCSYEGHKTVCRCEQGFVGERCEIPLDPCSSSPCWNGGTCTKTGYDTYNCTCPVEISCEMKRELDRYGNDADWYRQDTKPQPSLEACEQYCLDSPKCLSVHYTEGYCFVYNQPTTMQDKERSIYSLKECKNTPLFGGERCGNDLVNSCKNDTCSEHGMCQDLLGENPKCLCSVTGVFFGETCIQESNLCDPNPCVHGDCVQYGNVRYQCICRAGYSGINCEDNINECSLNPKGCFYNSTCVDRVNGYDCTCQNGFHGDRCKDVPDFCAANPCPEGICFSDYDKFGYTCKCEPPYRQSSDGTCEPVPPCDGVVCVNGTCGSDAKCQCVPGFEGSRCQHNINDCRNNPCQHGGQCVDLISDYQCNCRPGYDGKNCERNIPDCDGVCTESNIARCEDLVDDYRCICKPGYTGRNCTAGIDECGSYPCRHGGVCTDLVNDFSCQCPQGWTGKQCEYPEDFCSPAPCHNGGACYNMTDGFFCRCPSGSSGDVCGDYPDSCSILSPCSNSGACETFGGTTNCSCSDNYVDTSCQLIKNHCGDANTCKNEGKCTSKEIGFQCECHPGYLGTRCDTYNDPCSSNPCHSSARCISEKESYMCYCQDGGYLTENGCKAADDNFDLYMDDKLGDMPGYLRTPFVLPVYSGLTVMFWFRVMGSTSTILSLKSVSVRRPIPDFDEASFVTITSNSVVINASQTLKIDLGREYGNGQWHYIALSFERLGKIQIVIDSVVVAVTDMKTVIQIPEMMQVVFGSALTRGRISRLRIYRTILSIEDIKQSINSIDHLDSKAAYLVQTWANIIYTKSTFRKYPSEVGNPVCDKGFPACPGYNETMTPQETTTKFKSSTSSRNVYPVTSQNIQENISIVAGIAGSVVAVLLVVVVGLVVYICRRRNMQHRNDPPNTGMGTMDEKSYEIPSEPYTYANRYQHLDRGHADQSYEHPTEPYETVDDTLYSTIIETEEICQTQM